MLARSYVSGKNESIGGCDNIHCLRKLVAFRHLSNLHIADAEIAEAVGVALNTAHSLLVHRTWIGHRPGAVLAHGAWDARSCGQEPGSYR